MAIQHQASALDLDLSGLDLGDVEVFVQEGGRAIPEFAASTGDVCVKEGSSSCVKEKEAQTDSAL